jgi:replicative DNA helicase
MTTNGISPEVSLAGSILIDPRCLDEIRRTVTPELFGDPRCRAIFEAACELSDEGRTVDPVTSGAGGGMGRWLRGEDHASEADGGPTWGLMRGAATGNLRRE